MADEMGDGEKVSRAMIQLASHTLSAAFLALDGIHNETSFNYYWRRQLDATDEIVGLL